jgi:hypothetical protein
MMVFLAGAERCLFDGFITTCLHGLWHAFSLAVRWRDGCIKPCTKKYARQKAGGRI